ncbi:MAG: 50S ribosomal protein L22 [Proteobacteria bacterium]|nr:50S ribosomal protein L22 [Pseudomonadota bacterium]
METLAKLSNAKVSPQKCRLVADQIRGLKVATAIDLLTFSDKKSAKIIKKVLESAIANAEHNSGADVDELHVLSVQVNEGTFLKRIKARAKGRANRVLKRACHIIIRVSESR